MLDVLRWYVVLQIIGFAALPLTARAFRGLPDRGYAFARPIGLLATAALLWAGAIFGLWSNSGAIVAVIVIGIGVVGWLVMPRYARSVVALWRERRNHIVVVEAVFLVAFVAWAFFRAHFPEIEATEKPMEFGFLNGILRSQRFPPVDPWLSGSSISYYYLGYVLVAALTELSGVVPSVAFNLAIAMLFALTVTGAFAIGTTLVDGLRESRRVFERNSSASDAPPMRNWPSWIAGGLAAWFVALLGNWEGFFEILHAHGFGSAAFWQSLAIWHLNNPFNSTAWYPTDAQDNWWWFRASRVILDYPPGTPAPDGYNTINEFPFFSFLLGDLHPHVLALPFAFVCLAFALSFLRARESVHLDRLRESAFDLGFIAFLFGSMFLLNAWDILTYLFVLICVYAIRHYLERPGFDLAWLKDAAVFGVGTLLLSLVAYAPFYVTFRSQASGLLGIVHLHSHLSYFLIFWGPFLFFGASLVVADLVFHASPLPRDVLRGAGPTWTRGPFIWGAAAIVALVAAYFNAPALALVIPIGLAALVLVLRYLTGSTTAAMALARADAGTIGPAADDAGARPERAPAPVAGGAIPMSWATEHVYVMVLLFVAMLLLFGTEVVFIEDSFGNRMNTVFKLYFQAWEMLAIVGAYAVYYIGSLAFVGRPSTARERASSSRASDSSGSSAFARRVASGVWLIAAAVLIAGAFVYVPAALESRTDGFTSPMTLDGLAYYRQFQPDDANAIAWLERNVDGTPTIVEATGGSYSDFDEVAWMTGLPTILGWDFHEIQWRGASITASEDERKRDIDTIYRSNDAKQTLDLLHKYAATYVYVGPIEKRTYAQDQAGLGKFGQFMDVAYRNPGVTIYRIRGTP
jgi:YYY domain-containing protein